MHKVKDLNNRYFEVAKFSHQFLLKFYVKWLSNHLLWWPSFSFSSSPVVFPSIILNHPFLWLCLLLGLVKNTISKIFTSSTSCLAYQLWCYNSTIPLFYQDFQSSGGLLFHHPLSSCLHFPLHLLNHNLYNHVYWMWLVRIPLALIWQSSVPVYSTIYLPVPVPTLMKKPTRITDYHLNSWS